MGRICLIGVCLVILATTRVYSGSSLMVGIELLFKCRTKSSLAVDQQEAPCVLTPSIPQAVASLQALIHMGNSLDSEALRDCKNAPYSMRQSRVIEGMKLSWPNEGPV